VKGFSSNDSVKERYPSKKWLFYRYWLVQCRKQFQTGTNMLPIITSIKQALVTSFLWISFINDLGYGVFLQFSAAAHISRVNCAEIRRDWPRQFAYKIFTCFPGYLHWTTLKSSKRVLVISSRFQATTHISAVDCAKIIAARPKQRTHKICRTKVSTSWVHKVFCSEVSKFGCSFQPHSYFIVGLCCAQIPYVAALILPCVT